MCVRARRNWFGAFVSQGVMAMGFRVDVTIQGRRSGEVATMNYATDGDALAVVQSVCMALAGAGADVCGGLDLGHEIVRIEIVPVAE